MRTNGLPAELERRRVVAVQRYLEGYSPEEVADFFDVSVRSVWRWIAAFADHGPQGLTARAVSGRPCKLTAAQEEVVLAWLRQNATDHGFANELWTAQRIGELIRQKWSVSFNRRYLCTWLRDRNLTPQIPQRVPRERDPDRIAHWLATDWPRIPKKCVGCRPTWS